MIPSARVLPGQHAGPLRRALCVAALLVASSAAAAGQPVTAAAALPAATPLVAGGGGHNGPVVPGEGCSTVYATDGRQMLGGNNEDSLEPLAKVWFVPAGPGTYGLVLFGYSNYRAQGGMNDQGLFFDLLTVPSELPVPTEGKQLWPGTNYLIYDAMTQCATVACVVDLFERYYDADVWSMQAFFGDATGESVIIEPQVIRRQTGGYQVATNFYQSSIPPSQDPASACPRYATAREMLQGATALSVEHIRDVMAATHQDGPRARTVYTNVYDLVNRVVYLYYFSDYEHRAVIDLQQELAKGAHAYDLPALLPPNPPALQFFAADLEGYESLIGSRRVEVDPAFLAAYVGDYAPPGVEAPGPGDVVRVVPYGGSLMMLFPDWHRYELFPQSENSFFVVAWDRMNERFQVRFEVEFGLDEATGQVLHMDWVFGPGDSVRNSRLSPDGFVPYLPPTEPPPTTTTAAPTTTAMPTTTVPPQPSDADGGFPWVWMTLPAALLAGAAGWALGRRRRVDAA